MLTSSQVLSVLVSALESLETAFGCRGRWHLQLIEAPQSTGITDTEYLKAFRDQYEQKIPQPYPPLFWQSRGPGGAGDFVLCVSAS